MDEGNMAKKEDLQGEKCPKFDGKKERISGMEREGGGLAMNMERTESEKLSWVQIEECTEGRTMDSGCGAAKRTGCR